MHIDREVVNHSVNQGLRSCPKSDLIIGSLFHFGIEQEAVVCCITILTSFIAPVLLNLPMSSLRVAVGNWAWHDYHSFRLDTQFEHILLKHECSHETR